MKNNLLFLSLISFLLVPAIYSMQQDDDFNPRDTDESKQSIPLKLTLGFEKTTGISETTLKRFTEVTGSIESFWHDKNSTDKCVNALFLLTKPRQALNRGVVIRESVESDKQLQSFLAANFPIILGSAKAARDLARELVKESDQNLAQKKALPRDAILKQANVNLVFIKLLAKKLDSVDYRPF